MLHYTYAALFCTLFVTFNGLLQLILKFINPIYKILTVYCALYIFETQAVTLLHWYNWVLELEAVAKRNVGLF